MEYPLTRQGVRDLSGGKQKNGRTRNEPRELPRDVAQAICKHDGGYKSLEHGFIEECRLCGKQFDVLW